MVFFKRLSRSRSRSNSQSYVDNTYDSRHDSKTYDDQGYAHSEPPRDRAIVAGDDYDRPPVSAHSEKGPRLGDGFAKETSGGDMYSRRDRPVEVANQQAGNAFAIGGYRENLSDRTRTASNGYDAPQAGKSDAAAPNLLIEAFNQAVRPYSDKIEGLESEIADLRAYIASLERQQNEVHAWIDKRGLRPDVPPAIAQIMDSASHASSPTHAAATLNAQLDRKITIVNFDLHRLQDDLNDSLPTPSFSACMLKFLPDISRLSSLPSGPRYAFDLLLKLGGNLNSHGGLENGDEEDIMERKAFYGRLDEAMVDVVKGRFREEGDSWGVQREIKRIEKTGAYLRNWGVEPYFPQTLEVMRDGGHGGMPTSSAQAMPGGSAPEYA
ncbi:hypothetical protein CKM354_000626500 [Cercospora kikuchii]|uniref:Uncharacterized protein n=1 Tax=Cercospora kikuchii TaxID=84275 RepID=A0A9P3FI19_9PEZI|nr:uncharacterized protein CKM354_000626500 [Cercospora kikuchii]GIZ43020.1 hypothetical protein CKM354_000626500 [Cercospora kikuchii]